MAAPIVTWFNQANTAQLNSWTIGTVDAGTTSADLQLLIWNNRGGASAVSDMTSCTITTKDSSGGDTGELVTNTWIQAKCVSTGDATFTPIGGSNNTKSIKASGAGISAGVISGAVNDGTYNNAKNNFSEMVLHATVPLNASAGTQNFYVRVAYQYV
jgi:hypothetical protein